MESICCFKGKRHHIFYALLQPFDDFVNSLANSSNKADGDGKISESNAAHTKEICNDLNKVKTNFEELSEVAKECNNYLDSDNQNTIRMLLKNIKN